MRRGSCSEPGFPPFTPLGAPVEFQNPIEQLQGYLAEFAASYVEAGTPTLASE